MTKKQKKSKEVKKKKKKIVTAVFLVEETCVSRSKGKTLKR